MRVHRFSRMHAFSWVLLASVALWNASPCSAGVGDLVALVASLIDGAVESARSTAESIRSLQVNPLDDWRRARFQREIAHLSRALRDLNHAFRENATPESEIASAQRRIASTFEAIAGAKSGALIRQAMIDAGLTGEGPSSFSFNLEERPEASPNGALTISRVLEPSLRFAANIPRRLMVQRGGKTSVPSRISDVMRRTEQEKEKAEIVAVKSFRQMEFLIGQAKNPDAALSSDRVVSTTNRRGVRAFSLNSPESSSGEKKQAASGGEVVLSGSAVVEGVGASEREGLGAPLEDFLETSDNFATGDFPIPWPSGERRGLASPQRAGLSIGEVNELLDSRAKYLLLTIIVCVSLSVWAFYLGLMFRNRRSTSRRDDSDL